MNHNYAAGDDALKLMDVASVRLTRTMVVTKLSRTRTGFISLGTLPKAPQAGS